MDGPCPHQLCWVLFLLFNAVHCSPQENTTCLYLPVVSTTSQEITLNISVCHPCQFGPADIQCHFYSCYQNWHFSDLVRVNDKLSTGELTMRLQRELVIIAFAALATYYPDVFNAPNFTKLTVHNNALCLEGAFYNHSNPVAQSVDHYIYRHAHDFDEFYLSCVRPFLFSFAVLFLSITLRRFAKGVI
nr:MAG: putative glycoprotein 2 [Wufeng rodent arterivirus 2]